MTKNCNSSVPSVSKRNIQFTKWQESKMFGNSRCQVCRPKHSPTKFLQPANLTTYTILSLFTGRTRSSSLVSRALARPSVSSSLQITNRCFTYASPYLWNQLLLHSVNLILFIVLLIHLILRISPHHSHHLRYHHLSLTLPFTPDLKLISFTNPFFHSYSFRTDFTILTCTELKGHCFVCFSFWLRVLD